MGFKIKEEVKYMGITMRMRYMLFQNNYVKLWNKVEKYAKWNKLQLFLLGRFSVIKIMFYLECCFRQYLF